MSELGVGVGGVVEGTEAGDDKCDSSTTPTRRPTRHSTGIPESPTLVFALVGLVLLPPVIALGLDPRRLNARLEVGPFSRDDSPGLRRQVRGVGGTGGLGGFVRIIDGCSFIFP